MSLTAHQNSILNQASIKDGGQSFISESSKTVYKGDPIMVVGLGGAGIDAMLHIKRMVNETFKTDIDKSSGKHKAAPDNIRFIGIDSDKFSFKDKRTGKPGRTYRGIFLDENERIYVGDYRVVNFCRAAYNNNYKFVTDWLEPNGFTEEGICYCRQSVRLSLFCNYKAIMEKFKNDISELLNEQSFGKLSVFIIGSLCGTTGSGLLIDIPYIIQSALKSALNMNESDDVWDRLMMMGYFVTPDVNKIHYTQKSLEKRLDINGYAALKELDYLMGIQERGERFIQQYTNDPADTIDTTNPPYSFVNIISSEYKDRNTVSNAYDNAMLSIAESVMFFTMSYSHNYNLHSFIISAKVEMRTEVEKLKETGTLQPAGYRYGTIGASGRFIPIQDIMICLASKLFEKINEVGEAHGEPTTQEIKQIVGPRYFAFDDISLSNRLKKGISFSFENIAQDAVSYPSSALAAIRRGGNAKADFEEMYKSMEAIIESNFNNPETFAAIKENFNYQMSQFFKNTAPLVIQNPAIRNQKPTYGPRFANDILVGAEGGSELNTKAFIINEVNKHKSLYQEINEKLYPMYQKAELLREEIKGKIIGANSVYEKYMKCMVDIYNLKLQQVISLKLISMYDAILKMIADANENTYAVVLSVLDCLCEKTRDNMDIIGNEDTKESYEGAVCSQYLMNTDEVIEYINSVVDDAKLEYAADELFYTIFENIYRWTSKNEYAFDAYEDFKSFLANHFAYVLNISIDEIAENKYKKNYSTNYRSFDEFLNRKFNKDLFEEAEIRFIENPVFTAQIGDPDLVPGRKFVIVPKNCIKIKPNYESLSKRGLRNQVFCTNNPTGIICQSYEYGIPLFSFAPLESYEALYEEAADSKFYWGFHLCKSSTVNWRKLPALCLPGVRSSSYSNTREDERIKEVESVFDEAVETGVIQCRYGEVYAAFLKDFDVETKIKEAGNEYIKIFELRNEINEYFSCDNTEFNDCRFVLLKGRTLEEAKFWFVCCFELVDLIKSENKKRLRVINAIDQAEKRIDSYEKFKMIVKAWLAGTIQKEGPKFFYKPNNEDERILIALLFELKNSEFLEYSLYYKLFVDNVFENPNVFDSFLIDAEEAFDKLRMADDFNELAKEYINELKQRLSVVQENKLLIAQADEIIELYSLGINYLEELIEN